MYIIQRFRKIVIKLKLAIAVSLMTIMPNVAATAQEAEESLNPWTKCGIGAIIFDSNETAAAISNIIWDLGTTAISSNISSKDSCNGRDVKVAMYINETYNKLAEETATGKGEYLTAMTNMMGCSSNDKASIVTAVRFNLAETLSQESYANLSHQEKAEQYYNIVEKVTESDTSIQCSIA